MINREFKTEFRKIFHMLFFGIIIKISEIKQK